MAIQLIIILLITAFVTHRRTRFYILSFFFEYLYNNRKMAAFFGIHFADDRECHLSRKTADLYMDGLFVYLFTKFTGMPIKMNIETYKRFKNLQRDFAKNINIIPHFDDLMDKKMSLADFEQQMAAKIFIETNRVFDILPPEAEEDFCRHLSLLRRIVEGLMSTPGAAILHMFRNWAEFCQLRSIIQSVKEEKRLLLFVPQLTIIDTLSAALLSKAADLSSVTPADFLGSSSKYFVFVIEGRLTFITRNEDKNFGPNNLAFGPRGFQCPGNIFTYSFVDNIINIVRDLKIQIEGKPPIHNRGRFKNILNKKEIFLTLSRKREEVLTLSRTSIDSETSNTPLCRD